MPPVKSLVGPNPLGPSPARDMYVARVGSALTPRRISSILTQADQGQPAQWHDLLNELRQKDGVLHSVLQTREAALLGCAWDVVAPLPSGKRKPTRRSEKIAALCREWVNNVPNWDRGLAHLLDGNYKGFAVCEVTWRRSGRYIVPAGLHPIQGRRFAFDEQQRLRWYDDGLRPPPGDDFLSQHPRRFLVHQPRINGDSPTREGLGRVLAWLSCFATWSWRDWMLFGELFGKPWRILTLTRNGIQSEDETAAEGIVQDATASTAILLYENMKLEVKWPDAPGGASSSPSPAVIDKAGSHMALAVLGQLGTTGDVQNGLGGKGDARERVRKDILHADDVALSSTLRQLLAWCVEINFGPREPVPFWTFQTGDAGDTEAAARTLDTAKNKLGLRVPVAHARAVLAIPQPAPGEPCLGDPDETAAPVPEADAADPDPTDETPIDAPLD